MVRPAPAVSGRPPRRRWHAWLAIPAAVILLAVIIGAWFLHSSAFHRAVENYVLGQIEQGSGARASAAGLKVSLNPLQVELDGLVMHGREAASQPPLAFIPRLLVSLRWRGLLRGRIQLGQVRMVSPRFHVFRLADGNTNLPEPGAAWARRAQEARTLFSLHARDLEIHRGELALQSRQIPINLRLHGVELRLLAAKRGYTGRLRFSAMAVAASGAFTLSPQSLRFSRLSLSGSGLHATLSGSVRDFTNPTIAGDYQIRADWAKLPAPLRLPAHGAIRTLQVQGQWRWSPSAWTIAGTSAAIGAGRARGWSATAVWRAAPAGLTVSRLFARRGAEHVSLAGQWTSWRTLDLTGIFGSVDLAQASGLLAAAGVRSRWLPLFSQFDAAAAGAFQMQGRTRGPAPSNVVPRFLPRFALRVKLTPRGSPRQAMGNRERGIAVAGDIDAIIDAAADTLQLRHLDLQAAGSHLQASGSLASSAATLQVSFASPAIERFRRLARAAARIATRASAPSNGVTLPEFGGAVRFQGSVHGALRVPVFQGRLDLTRAYWGARRWDALTLAGTLTPGTLNLTQAALRLGSERVHAAGLISLHRYRLTPASRLRLTGGIDGVSLASLQTWAGVNYPVSGTLSASASAGGTWGQPQGQAHVVLEQARWHGQPVRAVSADWRLRGGVLSTANLAIELPRTRIAGSMALGLTNRTYTLHLASGGVALSGIAMLQSPRLALHGRLRFQLTGSGHWDRPQGELVLATSGLRGNGENLGDVGARVQLRQGQAQFHVADILPNGSFHLDGSIAVAAPYLAHARLALRDYDFDAWLERFTPANLTGHSQVSGTATLDGPLAQPDRLALRVALDPVRLALGGLAIHNQGPVVITVAHRRLALEPARIVAPDTSFTLQGSAALGDVLRPGFLGALTGGMAGRINLALVHSLHPATAASGEIGVAASLSGTLANPRVRGQVSIVNASLAEAGLPLAFDDIQGNLALSGRRVDVRSLTAHTGGGTLALTGFAADSSSGVNFALNARGQNLRLRYQGISATGNLQVRLSGQPSSALLAGAAQLNRVGLDPNFDLALFLASASQPALPPSPDSVLNHIRLDVHLTTGPQVQVATNMAHLQLQADVRLRGTLAQPSVLGRASASEGRILFAGNQYEVTKAQVQFVNPYQIEPLVDVSLATTVQQYDITLNIAGPPDKLAITYRSDPPLASADVMSLLATGQTTQAGASLANEASNFAPSEQLLGQALNNLVASRLHRLFGITQVQVNPDTGVLGPTGSGGTVTVEQQVSRNLKLTYTQNLSSSSQDIIQIDWNIGRSVGVTLNRDQFGLYGLKLTLRQRAH
jgi:translocation and assembly module TamB